MSKAYDFLKNCNFYYLLTFDSDYPAGRPISGILEADGVMYFGTRTDKAVYRQLKQNTHIGLVAFNKGRWLRLYADAEETLTHRFVNSTSADFPQKSAGSGQQITLYLLCLLCTL